MTLQIQEPTDCQKWRMVYENTEGMDKEEIIDMIIGLLGQIKEWELTIDKVINEPDEDWGLAEIEKVSQEMMAVNI